MMNAAMMMMVMMKCRGYMIDDYACDCNVDDDDDDLGVTLVNKDTKRNMIFFCDLTNTRNIYLNILNDFLKYFLFD